MIHGITVHVRGKLSSSILMVRLDNSLNDFISLNKKTLKITSLVFNLTGNSIFNGQSFAI